MKRLLYTIAVAVLISTALIARAELLQMDDARFGTGALTLDTRTGLSWLDLPLSLDLSYLQAGAAMEPGGQFAGFRHATATEVAALYNSAGFGQGFIPQSSGDFEKVSSLITLVGAPGATAAVGITGTPAFSSSVLLAYISFGYTNGVPGYFVTAEMPTTAYGLDTHYDSAGNWLVVVPEPSVCALLGGAGVCALVSARRKR